MTFENSSSDKIKLNSMTQWAIAMRRKWLLAIYILSAVIWYPVITVVKLTGEINRIGRSVPEVSLKSVMVHDFSSVIGFDSLSFLAVTALAFITAIQGFSYLYRRQTIDFYESQPVKKSSLFIKIYLNGFLMYLLTAAAGYILAFVIAGAMGIFRFALIAEAMVEFAELALLFLGIYSITILGTVVSGTLIMGIMVSVFLLSAEVVIRGLVFICSQTYLSTFYTSSFNVWDTLTSPFFTFTETAGRLSFFYTDDSVYRISAVYRHIEQALGSDIKLLIIAVVATALAWIAYKRRRSESAGHSVAFTLAEWILKFVIASAACILAGVMMDTVTQGAVAVVFIGIILTAFILCAIAEIIFESDFKALFKNPWHIAVVAAVGIGVILGYRFDVTGFETYIPEAGKVESCAIFNTYGTGRDYYEADGNMIGNQEYFEKYMHLKDIQGVEDIARYGQAVQVDRERIYRGLDIAYQGEDNIAMDESEMEYFWDKVVMYRMRNGKNVYRRIAVPEDIDPAMLDRITKSPEYSLCLYGLNDEVVDRLAKAAQYSELGFNSGCTQLQGDGELFKEFAKVYKKDVEENYSFSIAHNSDPVGTAYYSPQNNVPVGQPTYYLSYVVFPEYKNTVKFLEDQGLYSGELLPVEHVDKITIYHDPNVYKYYSDNEEYEYEEIEEKEYTDPGQIKTIMSQVHFDGEDWEWRSNNYVDYSYDIVVSMDSDYKPEGYSNRGGTYNLYFRYGKIPEIVNFD